MSTKSASARLNLGSLFEQTASQFQGLNIKEPGQWPILPKIGAGVVAAVIIFGSFWFAFLSDAHNQLQSERDNEPTLKQDYRSKLGQAVNLSELKKQKLRVQEYVEKQLPGKAEMDALLSDINQAGLGRGLQFELFRPGQVIVKDYYAELPISIRVSGRYHDIGAFTADIANLSRIVTLHNLNIIAPKDQSNLLSMDATARTYRYLDPAELEDNKKAAVAKKVGGTGK
jgi:type IV pilus assembly protein PilO